MNSLGRIIEYPTIITDSKGDKQALTHSLGETSPKTWLIVRFHDRITP